MEMGLHGTRAISPNGKRAAIATAPDTIEVRTRAGRLSRAYQLTNTDEHASIDGITVNDAGVVLVRIATMVSNAGDEAFTFVRLDRDKLLRHEAAGPDGDISPPFPFTSAVSPSVSRVAYTYCRDDDIPRLLVLNGSDFSVLDDAIVGDDDDLVADVIALDDDGLIAVAREREVLLLQGEARQVWPKPGRIDALMLIPGHASVWALSSATATATRYALDGSIKQAPLPPILEGATCIMAGAKSIRFIGQDGRRIELREDGRVRTAAALSAAGQAGEVVYRALGPDVVALSRGRKIEHIPWSARFSKWSAAGKPSPRDELVTTLRARSRDLAADHLHRTGALKSSILSSLIGEMRTHGTFDAELIKRVLQHIQPFDADAASSALTHLLAVSWALEDVETGSRQMAVALALLAAGARPDQRDSMGYTASEYVAMWGMEEMARQLPTLTDNLICQAAHTPNGDPPRNARVIEIFVERGLSIHHCDPKLGGAPIHIAALWSGPGIVATVLALGGNPNHVWRNKTPLQMLARASSCEKRSEIVKMFLAAGADPNVSMTFKKEQMSLIEFAKRRKKKKLLAILQAAEQ